MLKRRRVETPLLSRIQRNRKRLCELANARRKNDIEKLKHKLDIEEANCEAMRKLLYKVRDDRDNALQRVRALAKQVETLVDKWPSWRGNGWELNFPTLWETKDGYDATLGSNDSILPFPTKADAVHYLTHYRGRS